MIKYITLDDYYTVDQYNEFLEAARNNKVEFKEYILIKPPFSRFIQIDSEDLPKFINYEFASKTEMNFLISALIPVESNEYYLLQRRDGMDKAYEKYTAPVPLRNMQSKKNVIVFKGTSDSELRDLSRESGLKFYKWGHARGVDILVCFSPYIKGFISETRILLDFGKESDSGLKRGPKVPTYGKLEYYLNTQFLIKTKLENKSSQLAYFDKGKYNPVKRVAR